MNKSQIKSYVVRLSTCGRSGNDIYSELHDACHDDHWLASLISRMPYEPRYIQHKLAMQLLVGWLVVTALVALFFLINLVPDAPTGSLFKAGVGLMAVYSISILGIMRNSIHAYDFILLLTAVSLVNQYAFWPSHGYLFWSLAGGHVLQLLFVYYVRSLLFPDNYLFFGAVRDRYGRYCFTE